MPVVSGCGGGHPAHRIVVYPKALLRGRLPGRPRRPDPGCMPLFDGRFRGAHRERRGRRQIRSARVGRVQLGWRGDRSETDLRRRGFRRGISAAQRVVGRSCSNRRGRRRLGRTPASKGLICGDQGRPVALSGAALSFGRVRTRDGESELAVDLGGRGSGASFCAERARGAAAVGGLDESLKLQRIVAACYASAAAGKEIKVD
jgi:hypothetical protein